MTTTTVTLLLYACCFAQVQPLPGTAPLDTDADLAMEMVAGIDRYLTRELADSVNRREAPTRERLAEIIGVVDERKPGFAFEILQNGCGIRAIAESETQQFQVFPVRWRVFDGVDGEGLLVRQRERRNAAIVAIPDADQTPEQVLGLTEGVPPDAQFARRLAEQGYDVLVPALLSRSDELSGNPAIRFTNQPHREFIYRAAYEMGRHVIGYEVQTVLAGLTPLMHQGQTIEGTPPRFVAVMGYGEGGLIALHAAALDDRIQAVAVSGYFGPRENVWAEPIYRNVWSQLRAFGDAELLSMIAPRVAIIEASRHPEISGPPAERDGRRGAAPGDIKTPPLAEVRREFDRAVKMTPQGKQVFRLIESANGGPGSDKTVAALLNAMPHPTELAPSGDSLKLLPDGLCGPREIKAPFAEWNTFTQRLVQQSPKARQAYSDALAPTSVDARDEMIPALRDKAWRSLFGKLPTPTVDVNARTRLAYEQPKWQGYDVVLDVYPDVIAQGILLVPKGIREGERRPVVICQHGLEGRAAHTIATDGQPFGYYQNFASKLAERGFVVYSPQNPYIGGDKFRVLQRKANPLGLSLYSFIIGQHERTLDWLESLPFVDGERIGFYGLSYGGKTAMRVPAVLQGRYAAVICSGDFNEWIWKMTSIDAPFSYMFTGEYEMFTFNMGNTFNYAELAGLICPTPFMVERGHDDGVGIDEWVAYEYAKVRRLYNKLGIGDRTEIEYFNGPHQIHGQGTFEFLHKHLNWPEP